MAAVTAGAGDDDAIPIGDAIFMSRGISNCYQVRTPAGVVMINTGAANEAPAHTVRFDRAVGAPIQAIVFTQSHPDHIGGWQSFAQPFTEIIAQRNFASVRAYWAALAPYYRRRTAKLWAGLISAAPAATPDPMPTRLVDDLYTFTLGGVDFELVATPGGETADSMIVWLPGDRIAFSGNLMGPLLGHVPNLATLRGDKLRSALEFVESVDCLRALQPELLITGHGAPLRGRRQIRDQLTKIRDHTRWVHDRTVDGMNAGLDVATLMREIRPPDELRLDEGHGTVRWNVRAVYEEYTGSFRYQSTTELYDVPARAVAADLVELAGGATRILKRAARYLEESRPLEALHLTDIALAADPASRQALSVSLAAHESLLVGSGRENLSETRWLESEITALQDALRSGGDGP